MLFRSQIEEKLPYQEHGSRDLDLAFRPVNGHYIGRRLFVREPNPRVGLRFYVVNENALFTEKSAMIASGDGDRFIYEIFVL